jgi:hypothetical protein
MWMHISVSSMSQIGRHVKLAKDDHKATNQQQQELGGQSCKRTANSRVGAHSILQLPFTALQSPFI